MSIRGVGDAEGEQGLLQRLLFSYIVPISYFSTYQALLYVTLLSLLRTFEA